MSPKTLLSAAPTDPFASAARPISALEHYLLDHRELLPNPAPLPLRRHWSSHGYNPRSMTSPLEKAHLVSVIARWLLTAVVVNVLVSRGGFSTCTFPTPKAYMQGIKTEWISLALTDPGMLNGILIPACRSLHYLHGGSPHRYLEYALRYKMACIASLNKAISEEGNNPRDSTIAKAVILAGDEVVLRSSVPCDIAEAPVLTSYSRSPLATFWLRGNTLKARYGW